MSSTIDILHLYIRRGPMYSAYAELREWKLRAKYNEAIVQTQGPQEIRRRSPRPVQDHPLPQLYRKENNPLKKYSPMMSPPPPPTPTRASLRRSPSSSMKMGEDKSSRSGVFTMRQSYEYSMEYDKRGGANSKGMLRKTTGSFRQNSSSSSSSTTTSWMTT